MRISDWSSDVCSSDLVGHLPVGTTEERERALVLDTGTRGTGGQHVTLLTEIAIEQALRKLARELASQYKVVYGRPDRQSVVEGKSVEVRVALGGRRLINKKKKKDQ